MAGLELKFFDDCANEPAKPWLIKGVLALDEDSSWYGPPGGLKSSLLTDISVHGAAGRNWRGFKTKMRFGTVYFALERAGLQRRRLAAYSKRDGHAGLPIAVADKIIDLTDEATVQIVVDTVKAAEERFGVLVGLIVIDTYAKAIAATGGDEDKAQHVNLVATILKRIHEQLGHAVHIATIGHTGKDETKGERGSSAKTGHIDLGVQISGDKVKTATITKANDQAEGVLTSFAGEEVVIGKDEDGDDLTAFIVSDRPVQAAPEARSPLSDNQVNALHTLKVAIKEHGQAGAVEVSTWKAELFRRGVLDQEARNPREPFRRLKAALIKTKRIEEDNGLIRFTSGNAIPSTPQPNSPPIAPATGGNLPLTTLPPLPVR